MKLSTMTAPTSSGNSQKTPSSGPLLQGRGILGAIHLLSPDPEQQASCQNTNPNDKFAHGLGRNNIVRCPANISMIQPTSGGHLARYQFL